MQFDSTNMDTIDREILLLAEDSGVIGRGEAYRTLRPPLSYQGFVHRVERLKKHGLVKTGVIMGRYYIEPAEVEHAD
ncbi:MAG: hypothetical protein ACP5C4_07430 [Methanomicrobiales archaeon]